MRSVSQLSSESDAGGSHSDDDSKQTYKKGRGKAKKKKDCLLKPGNRTTT